jgi:NADPH:quinone reductase-like Zn-dependent oxidoreductase
MKLKWRKRYARTKNSSVVLKCSFHAAEVLIELDTAGVGPWDATIRAGWYPCKKPKFPLVLGTDVVAQAGSWVRGLKVGGVLFSRRLVQSASGCGR